MPSRMMMRRIQIGLSQEEFGNKIGQHQSIVSRIEAGKRRVSLRDAIKISAALKCSLSWLAEGDEVKEPCGECHIQPGEICDLCGAKEPPTE